MSIVTRNRAVAACLVALVGGYEGLRTNAYFDPGGIPTICYGETKGVRMGDKLTKPECDAMLIKRLDEFAAGVEKCVTRPMPPHVNIAFVSLAYNIGTGAFCRSSVVRNWNAGHEHEACDAFRRIGTRALTTGRELPGLVRRRGEESQICHGRSTKVTL